MRVGSPSATAEMVCYWRALEATLPPEQRVLDDVYALGFLGSIRKKMVDAVAVLPLPARRAFLRQLDQALQGAFTFILARHRAIDQLILTTHSDQVVLLGAGYDTRPARLRDRLCKSQVFEVDHPDTARRKAQLAPAAFAGTELAPTRRITIDFAHESIEERLIEGGLDAGASTIWIWEGVSMYLTEQAVRDSLGLFSRLSGPDSVAVCDLLSDPLRAGILPGAQMKMLSKTMDWFYSEPFLWHCPQDQVASFFSSCGLCVREDLGLKELIHPDEKRFSSWFEAFSPSLRLIISEPAKR